MGATFDGFDSKPKSRGTGSGKSASGTRNYTDKGSSKGSSRAPYIPPKTDYQAEQKRKIKEKINGLDAEIKSLNTTLKDLTNQQSNYQKALEFANAAKDNINSSLKEIATSIDNFNKFYVVNGKTADGGKLIKYQSNLNGRDQNL